VKLGMTLPSFVVGVDGPTIREWCRRIDDGPYSCVAVGERVAYPSHDLITSLAFAAAATRRVRLVSTIVVLPSHDPVRIAKQAATIDVLSEGRLTLGVGVGGRDQDYLAVGTEPTRRFARLDEQVDIMRAVWRGEAPVVGVPPIGPAPVQAGGPPLLTAAMGPKSLARSAVWADGLSGFDLAPDAGSVAATNARVRDAWTAAGRAERPWLATSSWFALGDGASDRLNGYARNYLATFGDEAASAMAGLCRLDDPGRVRDALSALAAAGCDEFVLVPTTDDVTELDRLERALDLHS
jgi:alkanesulfonate monooxygenase SsuD/methylene tetrahydromethanopterin reductase-like flavin-dependent oxidoreductase (luciferase family)